ncbi:hypothetical protein PYH66_05960 [Staphylococcus delphini]|uniref:hypothetical protein n=1 Tax=Staphylococcus delphini TaxID=53344 RepID=UPI00336519E1
MSDLKARALLFWCGWDTKIFDGIDVVFLFNLSLMIFGFDCLYGFAFRGAGPSTKFGLIEMFTRWKPNWILGAVQKSHV